MFLPLLLWGFCRILGPQDPFQGFHSEGLIRLHCWLLLFENSAMLPLHRLMEKKVKVLVAQLCPTLCNPMDCSLPDSSVHGILQARLLKWVAIPEGLPPPQGSNLGLLHCRQILHHLSHQGNGEDEQANSELPNSVTRAKISLLTEMRRVGPTPPRGWGFTAGFTQEVLRKPGTTGTSRETASQGEGTSVVRRRVKERACPLRKHKITEHLLASRASTLERWAEAKCWLARDSVRCQGKIRIWGVRLIKISLSQKWETDGGGRRLKAEMLIAEIQGEKAEAPNLSKEMKVRRGITKEAERMDEDKRDGAVEEHSQLLT